MSVTYGFYNSLNGDRKYNTNQLSELFDGIIKDGVFMSVGDALIVSAAEGMNVNVGSGRAWFNHTWTNNDAPILLPITQSEVVLDRIDTVVLEVNSNDDVRANAIKIIKGVPSSEPVVTELIHDTFLNQYPLAYIYVSAGVIEILSANIENTIGTSDCPFVTGILETVNIDTLLAQWDGEFHDWIDQLEEILDENVAGNLLNLINAHEADNAAHVPHLGMTTNSENTYSVTSTKAIADGSKFSVKFNTAATGTATLNVSSDGTARTLKKPDGTDFKPKAGIYSFIRDGVNFQLLSSDARNVIESTDDPSGGDNGDIWLKYV